MRYLIKLKFVVIAASVMSTGTAFCGGPPANDLCENATPVSVNDPVDGSTINATIDDGFPFCGTTITAPGVWYSVTGNGTTMTATTCSEFTEYNTKISVYCSDCKTPICLGGNDDDCDLFGELNSSVAWCSQFGVVYLILVHGSGDLTGGFNLRVFPGAICNDPTDCMDGFACGDPNAGSCFETNGSPFCNNVECCKAVCEADPFCCQVLWDSICVHVAQQLCAGCGDPAAGSCLEPNGTPGCDDDECCALVCDFDPLCCEETWDSLCVDEAAKLCDPPCLADINGDTIVSTADLLALFAAWGPNPGHPADLNGDNVVNTADLKELFANWGPCE